MESLITKCEADDTHRCQSVTSQGQCLNLSVQAENGDWGNHCQCHGGNRFIEGVQKNALRNYQLDKFHAKLQRHATAPNIKSLRDEVAILRMMLEEKLNRCTDDMDLVLHSGSISDMVVKIEKLVSSCHKLEGSMGQLLDKQAILQFASEVISIIGDEVTNEEVIEQIGDKIMSAVGRLSGGKATSDKD